MKEIVVGIDFSKSSILAFQYSLKIATATGADIKLVYVSKKRDTDSTLVKNEEGVEESVEGSFNNLIQKYQKEIKGKISYKIHQGKIYEEIANQAKYTDAEMIITGAHGMSGFEEFWVGNNANKIIGYSEKPVLTIKKSYKIKSPVIEKIVIPIDSTFETTQKIPFTLKLAEYFKAQINLLSLYSSKVKNVEDRVDNNTREAMQLIIKSGLRYINEKKECDNITRSTIDYAQKRNADLISIMTEQEFASNNVLMGSYAQQMINQSPLPVLSHKTRMIMPSSSYLE